jgi:glucose-1-phosphate thymidylyltransferase
VKGIILAGGEGTRLHPVTLAISKQLIPIYNKPLIYYPLTTLILAGIREVLIITKEQYLSNFTALLGDGTKLGMRIDYQVQKKSDGIPNALIIGEPFIGEDSIALILGDNFFYGAGLGRALQNIKPIGAKIFVTQVSNPSEFGVLEFDKQERPIRIIEKPKATNSNFAVTGLYFYSNDAVQYAKQLNPSARGETEISDLNNIYLEQGRFEFDVLSRNTVWLDTGSFEGIQNASDFVRIIETRQQLSVGDPYKAAKIQGWI